MDTPRFVSDVRAAQVADSWRDDRVYLLATASRILADPVAAEDVVAEAYARFAAQQDAVRDARGWLLVVVRRIAVDRLRSAHLRLSEPADPTEPKPDPAAVDPADRVTLDDELRRALSVVLDRLTPGERAAFLLHDVFGLPFDDVGLLVGRSGAACRQLASRARRAIRVSDPEAAEPTPPLDRRLDRVAERFVTACSDGDVDGLAALLCEDVSGWAMRGGVVLSEVHGVDRVSARAVSFFGRRSRWGMVPFGLDDDAAVLITLGGAPAGVIRLIVGEDGLIGELRGVLLAS